LTHSGLRYKNNVIHESEGGKAVAGVFACFRGKQSWCFFSRAFHLAFNPMKKVQLFNKNEKSENIFTLLKDSPFSLRIKYRD
jgi:hypothetical protein